MKFIEDTSIYNPSNSFIAHISAIESKKQLLEELYERLQFPSYFGFNWDALFDCLRDFSWIKEQRIVIIHDFPIKMDITSIRTYLEILYDSVHSWKDEDEHILEIVFPYDQKAMILEILQSIEKERYSI